MFDWDEIEAQAGGKQFKDYAPNGEYKAVLKSVAVKDAPTWKSPAVVFEWSETDEYKFPRTKFHALSITNPKWRMFHHSNILMAFGIAKEQARKLVEQAEKDQDRIKLVKAYQALYNQIAQRHPQAEVVVQTQMKNGQPVLSPKGTPLSESDFLSPSVRLRDNNSKTESVAADRLEEIPFL